MKLSTLAANLRANGRQTNLAVARRVCCYDEISVFIV